MQRTRFKNVSTVGPRALMIGVLLLGGSGGGTMLARKDATYTIKPTSVSVITGGAEEADLKLAEYLTKELKERTSLHVMEQSDVSKAIPSYPIAVKTVEHDNGKSAWVDPSEKVKLEKIQTRSEEHTSE